MAYSPKVRYQILKKTKNATVTANVTFSTAWSNFIKYLAWVWQFNWNSALKCFNKMLNHAAFSILCGREFFLVHSVSSEPPLISCTTRGLPEGGRLWMFMARKIQMGEKYNKTYHQGHHLGSLTGSDSLSAKDSHTCVCVRLCVCVRVWHSNTTGFYSL